MPFIYWNQTASFKSQVSSSSSTFFATLTQWEGELDQWNGGWRDQTGNGKGHPTLLCPNCSRDCRSMMIRMMVVLGKINNINCTGYGWHNENKLRQYIYWLGSQGFGRHCQQSSVHLKARLWRVSLSLILFCSWSWKWQDRLVLCGFLVPAVRWRRSAVGQEVWLWFSNWLKSFSTGSGVE